MVSFNQKFVGITHKSPAVKSVQSNNNIFVRVVTQNANTWLLMGTVIQLVYIHIEK